MKFFLPYPVNGYEWTYIYGLRISEDIQMTAFSQELRRVQVSIPAVRNWRCTFMGGPHRQFRGSDYAYLIELCGFVLKVLDLHETPDPERSVVLAEALATLQTGDVELMKYFADRLIGSGEKKTAGHRVSP